MIRHIMRERVITALLSLSAAFVAGGWLWAWLALRNIPQELIIHFDAVRGISAVGNLSSIAGICIFGLALTAFNALLSFSLAERSHFLGKFTAAMTLFMAVLIFISLAAIISVN